LTDVLQDAVAYYRGNWSRVLAKRKRDRKEEGKNGTGAKKEEQMEVGSTSESPSAPEANDDSSMLPEEEGLQLYLEQYNTYVRPLMPVRSFVKIFSKLRKQRLKARIEQHGPGLWNRVIAELRELTDFARKGTWMDFDYVISERGCAKLLEGGWRKDMR